VKRVILATMLACGAAGWGESAEPFAVHVKSSTPKAPTKEAAEELRQRSEAARTAYADLEEALKKQHGKDPEKWPADERGKCQAAHDAFLEAQTDWFYSSGLKQKDIDDSARELAQALTDKKLVRVAAVAEDADLVVEVVGRAKVTHEGWGGQGTAAAQLVLRVGPGGRVDVPALAQSGTVWNAKRGFWMRTNTDTIHEFTVEAPYWVLISTKPGMGWMASYKGVAGQAAEAIGRFGVENSDKLAAARRATP